MHIIIFSVALTKAKAQTEILPRRYSRQSVWKDKLVCIKNINFQSTKNMHNTYEYMKYYYLPIVGFTRERRFTLVSKIQKHIFWLFPDNFRF